MLHIAYVRKILRAKVSVPLLQRDHTILRANFVYAQIQKSVAQKEPIR